MADACRMALDAGYPVIADATFLQRHIRKTFYGIARDFDREFIILDFLADEISLKKRIEQRDGQGLDASEADFQVQEYQLQHQQPLDELESRLSIKLDATIAPQVDELVKAISMRKKKDIATSYTDIVTG